MTTTDDQVKCPICHEVNQCARPAEDWKPAKLICDYCGKVGHGACHG
jgi:hypothetical protein